MEIWKEVKGYENLYEVSNLGNVKSLNYNGTKKERILKKMINKYGYEKISLCNKGNVKNKVIHQLVADAFLINLENKNQVNHINGIKTDNRVENLEWNTAYENTNHSIYKLNNKPYGVNQRKIDTNEIQKIKEMYKNGSTLKEISNIYNVSISTISLIKNNKRYANHV